MSGAKVLAAWLLAFGITAAEPRSTSSVQVVLPSPGEDPEVTVLALPERGPKMKRVQRANGTVMVLLADPEDNQPWALAGPSWVSEPLVGSAPEVIKALAARRWTLSLEPVGEVSAGPSFLRLLPLNEQGLPAGPLWAYPVLWQDHRSEVRVPAGKWRASLYVAGGLEQDLGVLPEKGELPPRRVFLKPAAGLAFRVSQHPGSPFCVWPFPEERWQELYCALTGPGLHQLAGGVWAERVGWVRLALEKSGSVLVAGEGEGWPPQL